MRLNGSLIRQYRRLHSRSKIYRGGSTLRRHLDDIARLVREIPTSTILDYGCGKGLQYTEDAMHQAWGGIMPTLFDPGVLGLDKLPEGTFDGVICTGVLEHVPQCEVEDAIAKLARYADKWAFISIGCSLSNKSLPDGRNVHVTLQPEDWWRERLTAAFQGKRLELSFIWR